LCVGKLMHDSNNHAMPTWPLSGLKSSHCRMLHNNAMHILYVQRLCSMIWVGVIQSRRGMALDRQPVLCRLQSMAHAGSMRRKARVVHKSMEMPCLCIDNKYSNAPKKEVGVITGCAGMAHSQSSLGPTRLTHSVS